jgi:phosphoglycolate phosphatase
MIGDTTYDLEMARSAGVEAIGVAWGHHSVDRLSPLAPVVDTVAELDQMLCERLGLG